MLLKKIFKKNIDSEARHDYNRSGHMHSTILTDLYKIIWKLNMLLKNILKINAVSKSIHNCKECIHMNSTLTSLYKTIWKLNNLINYKFKFHT
ncbi:uncharacterized protein LOC126549126 [Aphis gossypii]|uniref:uncharacterized protein LOC126549126 n=1 Tax=Aphis gossypii TaxID=80765 RepID=UPI0021594C62|nr:uncharacterized protein LOC126549126 [Aphis gossypii]